MNKRNAYFHQNQLLKSNGNLVEFKYGSWYLQNKEQFFWQIFLKLLFHIFRGVKIKGFLYKGMYDPFL